MAIDLHKKSSIDHHFKFKKGFGELKPPIVITGISPDDYALCFKKIRAWRKLTKQQQKELTQENRKLDQATIRKFLKNRKALMKMRDVMKVNAILNGDDTDDEGEEERMISTTENNEMERREDHSSLAI